jgi:pyruvate,water dikinase
VNGILSPQSPLVEVRAKGGGKAASLAALSHNGFAVPAWICLDKNVLSQFMLSQSVNGLNGRFSEEASRLILESAFPPSLWSSIRAALEAAGLLDAWVAVRSSASKEDSADHSFAGMFSSFLFQRGEEQIQQAIRACWASGFSRRVQDYCTSRGIPVDSLDMAVVIQKMIPSDSAGVVFTRNPVRPLERDTLSIESVFGVGEGLVSGALEADHFEVERASLNIRTKALAEHSEAFRQAAGGCLRRVPLEPAIRTSPSLTDEQVSELARLSLSIEKALGMPVDIEWALHDGVFYLLQARPITSLPPDALFDASVSGDQPVLWDNSNIIESYCGVTTPLTYSHVNRAYRKVYRQFCELMGVPDDVVEQHEAVFRNMLGLVRGRIYYNLGNWYNLLFLFPAASMNSSFMETMMGVKESLGPETSSLFDFTRNPPAYPFWTKYLMMMRSSLRILFARKWIADFEREVGDRYREAKRTPFGTMSLPEQCKCYHTLETEITGRWKAPIINDTRCMVHFGLLKRLSEKWIGRDNGVSTLHNDLLCGEIDIESTRPTKLLMQIAAEIDKAGDPTRSWFLQSEPRTIHQSLKQRLPQAYSMFERFLEDYGFRCPDELKLEEKDLLDDPSFAIESIQGYLRARSFSVPEMEKREIEIRQRAEREARQIIGPIRWPMFLFVLKSARAAVKDRERLRLMRSQTFGVLRRLLRGMGENMYRIGAIAKPEDVFYLSIEEIIAYAEGRSISATFQKIVESRRAEFEEFRRTPPPPDRFLSRGTASLFQRYAPLLSSSQVPAGSASEFSGIPCCPGVVEAKVRVAPRLQDAMGIHGEILVTERTDPGWVPVFPLCAGLLVERGSLLSHSAVVAREFGIPTIVGVSGGLMSRLKTGQRVRMDGSTGQIQVLDG